MKTNTKIGDRYIVLEKIGHGGVGTVYKCNDSVMNNVVAVKLIDQEDGGQNLLRFQREAKTTAKLDHPNIVKVLDFGEMEGKAFLVLEYLDGQDLETLIQTEALNRSEVYAIFLQILEGLKYAHGKGVVHRDLKPSNIMLKEDPRHGYISKICDFGLAKLLSTDQFLTKTGATLGSPSYMSPECALGEVVGHRTDLYSFGCMLFEALTGSLPFDGDTAFETMLKRTEDKPARLEDVSDEEFSPALEELIACCLEINPENRVESAEKLIEVMERLEDDFIDSDDTVYEDQDLENEPNAETVLVENNKKPIFIAVFLLMAIGSILIYRQLNTPTKVVDTKKIKVELKDSLSPVSTDDLKPKLVVENYKGRKWHSLYGVVTDKNLRMIEGNRKIKYLKLVTDDMAGPGTTALTTIPLVGLSLKQSAVSDLTMKNISSISTLEELYLNRAIGFTKEAMISLLNLKNLRTLYLDEQPVEDDWINLLIKLNKLEDLSLRRCSKFYGKEIDKLSSLPNLKSLTLTLSGFKGSYTSKLAKLKHLKYLRASNLSLNDNDIKALTKSNIEKLELQHNPITGKGLRILARMKSLKELKISDTNSVSSEDISTFKKHKPYCSIGIGNKKFGNTSD